MREREYKIRECPVQFQDFIHIGDTLWYAANGFNGLFCADMITRVSKFIGFFPNELKYAHDLYGGVCRWHNKLVFAPFLAENIAIYDIENEKFETYSIPEFRKDTNYEFRCKFMAVETFQSSIFFIGHTYPVIMQLDMMTGRITLHFEWYKEFEKYGKTLDTFIFDRHIVRLDKYFYVTSRYNNVMMKYNMENNQFEFFEMGDKSARYSALIYDGNFYWTIDNSSNELCKYSEKTGVMKRVLALPGEAGNCDIVYWNKYIWIFSKRFLNTVLTYDMIYDISTNHLEILNLKESHDRYGVIFAKNENEDVYCMYPDADFLYKLKYLNNQLITNKIEFQYVKNLYNNIFERQSINGIFGEKKMSVYNTHTSMLQDLSAFLEYIDYNTQNNEDSKQLDVGINVGEKIWNLASDVG